MTFEKIISNLTNGSMKPQEAYNVVSERDNMKHINYYVHINEIQKDPLTDSQLQELKSIVDLLQILYTSDTGSPVSDSDFDSLQETLIDMGIPRLTGSIEINDSKKLSHQFTTLRGTLDKVYYLTNDEPRTNKSRKYLDQWIKSAEDLYYSKTGKSINLNDVTVTLQAKMDGCSCIMEFDGQNSPNWLSRGDTQKNRASDISHIMKQFNDVFCNGEPVGMKFEVMMPEESLNKINDLMPEGSKYKNSRQIVISILNSLEPDFKSKYLYPVPLRIIHPGETVEQIHPLMYEKFPTKICKLSDREIIRKFANEHRYVTLPNGDRLRTDGVVITITNPEIQKILGRDNNINNFEVAYKFTEESAITKVKRVEFYVSEFGYITPVLVVNDVILKGNTINHISLSNKERFNELSLQYGDEVKVTYDIIPYATIDETCRRQHNGRKIEFVKECPRCGSKLDLTPIQVQCKNPLCPTRQIGRILNYCNIVRIQNIGYNTLDMLWAAGFLDKGIRSLYKLKKKANEIQDLDGFGQLKTHKIISEIEAKRRLNDYDFFGALGIEGLSTKTFQIIFGRIPLDDFLNMIQLKSFELLKGKLMLIPAIGPAKSDLIYQYFSNSENRNDFEKLLKEVRLIESYSESAQQKIKVVFSGCRPNEELRTLLSEHGYDAIDNWNNSAKYLVVPYSGFTSSKVSKAMDKNIPIILLENITRDIPGLI